METALYVMAILGCGDAGTGCREVRLADVPYQSVAACASARGQVLERNTDLDFPMLMARCRRGKAASGGGKTTGRS